LTARHDTGATALEHAEDAVSARAMHAELLTGVKNTATLALRLRCKSGQSLSTNATSSIVRDGSGKVLFLMTTLEVPA